MILDAGVFIVLDNPAEREIVLELVRRLRDAGKRLVTNDASLAVLADLLDDDVLTTDPDDLRLLGAQVLVL